MNSIELLKKIRQEKAIALIELAQIMGVSSEYLAKIEMHEIEPTKEQVETIRAFIEGKL